jgi:hypothetical protein
MLVPHLIKETLLLTKRFGPVTLVALSFLYFISLITLSSSFFLTRTMEDLAKSTEFEIFFHQEATLDEIQFLVSQVESEKWVQQASLRPMEETLIPTKESFQSREENLNSKQEALIKQKALIKKEGEQESSFLEALEDLHPSLQVKGEQISLETIASFLKHLRSYSFVEDILYNLEGQSHILSLAYLLRQTSSSLLFLALFMAGVMSHLITKTITDFRRSEVLVFQSLGASKFFITTPMILFLLFIQPFAFILAWACYLLFSAHAQSLIAEIHWLKDLLPGESSMDLSRIFYLWAASLFIFVFVGALKTLVGTKTRSLKFFSMLCFLFSLSMSLPGWSKELSLPFSNLVYKQKRIQNELELIHKELLRSQNKTISLREENLHLKQLVLKLFYQSQKSQAQLRLLWKSDLQKFQTLLSQGQRSLRLVTLGKKHAQKLRENQHSLALHEHHLENRQIRLKKLHHSMAETLNLKYHEYEGYLKNIQEKIKELSVYSPFFLNPTHWSGTFEKTKSLVSPFKGTLVHQELDPHLGVILIIEESPSTHFVISALDSTPLKKGDTLNPGDLIGMSYEKNPKIQVRILNQIIPQERISTL